jgi:hypothetical protein
MLPSLAENVPAGQSLQSLLLDLVLPLVSLPLGQFRHPALTPSLGVEVLYVPMGQLVHPLFNAYLPDAQGWQSWTSVQTGALQNAAVVLVMQA